MTQRALAPNQAVARASTAESSAVLDEERTNRTIVIVGGSESSIRSGAMSHQLRK